MKINNHTYVYNEVQHHHYLPSEHYVTHTPSRYFVFQVIISAPCAKIIIPRYVPLTYYYLIYIFCFQFSKRVVVATHSREALNFLLLLLLPLFYLLQKFLWMLRYSTNLFRKIIKILLDSVCLGWSPC